MPNTTTKTKKPAAKKLATKKPAAKKKAPVKKKPAKKPKKPLTDEQKAKLKIRELKVKSLVKEEPKRLPITAFSLYFGEYAKGKGGQGIPIQEILKEAAKSFKTLSASELEVCLLLIRRSFPAETSLTRLSSLIWKCVTRTRQSTLLPYGPLC